MIDNETLQGLVKKSPSEHENGQADALAARPLLKDQRTT
jgi:hypothetical protein